MLRKALCIIVISLLFYSFNSKAQSNFSVKYFGLTIHPFGDYSAEVQPYKLDKNARFVLNFGGFASYEKFVWFNMLSVKIKQGIFSDCSAGLMGVSHIGAQLKLISGEKHRLSFAIGPTFLYRKSWERFDIYDGGAFWNKYNSQKFGDIEYKIILYGAEFEYDYKLSEKADLSVNLVPGFPFAFTFSIGVKYWLDTNFKTREKLVIPKSK